MAESAAASTDENRRGRFSVARLLLWATFTCCFGALFAYLPASGWGVAVAAVVGVLFLAFDLYAGRRLAGVAVVAYFAAALSNCVAAALLFFYLWEPTPQVLFPAVIARVIAAIVSYIMAAAALSIVSLALAFSSPTGRSRKVWFVLLNLPGIVAACWLAWVFAYELWWE